LEAGANDPKDPGRVSVFCRLPRGLLCPVALARGGTEAAELVSREAEGRRTSL
jgi:hypothetical protein